MRRFAVLLALVACVETAYAECSPCEGTDSDMIVYRPSVRWCWDPVADPIVVDYEVEVLLESWVHAASSSHLRRSDDCHLDFVVGPGVYVWARYRGCHAGPAECGEWSELSSRARRVPPFDHDGNGVINGYDFFGFRFNMISGLYGGGDFARFREAYLSGVPPEDMVLDTE